MGRLSRRILRIHPDVVAALFLFWIVQFILWTGMIVYVQFFYSGLGRNVLYVTQISHWALVEAAGTAAISSWALLQARRNEHRIKELHDHVTNGGP